MSLFIRLFCSLSLFLCFSKLIAVEVCPTCPVNSIQSAISLCEKGDTIYLAKAIYKEHDITINKPLTIIGIDRPLIDGEEKGGVFKVQSDSVSIIGITIIRVGVSFTSDHAAIKIYKSKYFKIEDIVLEELFFGFLIEKSSFGIIRGNTIAGIAKSEYNSGNGVHLWYSKNILIENNIVQGVRDGIYLEFADSITVRGNISKNNLRYGLHFMFSNHSNYMENVFESNGAGVAVMFSKFIKMNDNTFQHNWGTASFGLLLKEINDLEVMDNVFEDNTIAISVEGANRVVYSGNILKGNGWAVKVRGACYANHFKQNNFMNNSFDLSYNSRMNDNVFENNYWSNYSGYDLDRDGIGDVPHRPVKLFSYIVNRTPEAIVLLRSLFIDIIDFSEKISPVFTPDELQDKYPLMKPS